MRRQCRETRVSHRPRIRLKQGLPADGNYQQSKAFLFYSRANAALGNFAKRRGLAMRTKITWVNYLNAQADGRGYWRSLEGRFDISPRYFSRVYPLDYQVTDTMRKADVAFDTVKECKRWAQDAIDLALSKEIP
jgi:hypothetical protein